MNDVHQSLRDIQASPEQLREEMVRLSKYGYRRSRDWVTGMPLIIIDQPSGVTTTSSSEYHLLTSSHGTTLRMARRSALKDASAYVAISYCCDRANSQWSVDDSDEPIPVICEDLSRRPSNAPLDILYRSIAYAEAQDINAIWIDQECIDQSDPVDKKNAIQEMDMVYEDSNYPIAVLDFMFQTQTELDVFASICDEIHFTFDPSQIEVLEAMLMDLSSETWFERAWTLQESVSAGGRMILLLSCPGLQKSPHFGLTPGEFEICLYDFQHAMVNVRSFIEEGLAAGVWPDSSSAINASNCADVLWNYIPTFIPDFAHDTGTWEMHAPHGRVRNAAQALTFLDNRFNSCFPDRLAILANLCDYERRMKIEVLEHPDSSFSICALTLAILNGDMSLLGGYRDKEEGLRCEDGRSVWSMDFVENHRSSGLVYQNDDYDLQSNTYGFSWGPKPSACLKNITYLEELGAMFRLQPATLSMHGLRVRGVLWNMNCTVSVPKTQGKFASRWQEEVAFQNGEGLFDGLERQRPLVQEFFWLLLHELIKSGFCELSRTIWNFVQPLGRSELFPTQESVRDPPPYSYDMIFGHLVPSSAAIQRRNYDEQEVRSRIRAPHLNFDPEKEVADRPLLQRLLIERVCKDGELVCGAPVDATPLNKQPHVWFEACKMGDRVFTPVTNVGDGAARSDYELQALSWKVLTTGQSADDCDILHCFGRRRGLWRVEGLDHQDYILE